MHPGHPLVPFLVSMASETIKQKEELNSHFGDKKFWKITAHTYLLDTEKITVILCITAIQHGRTMELRCQTKLKCVTWRPCFSHVIVEFNLEYDHHCRSTVSALGFSNLSPYLSRILLFCCFLSCSCSSLCRSPLNVLTYVTSLKNGIYLAHTCEQRLFISSCSKIRTQFS